MTERNIQIYDLSWNGIQIKVSYEANWLDGSDDTYKVAHLQLESINPDREPLPMTETGYRSHFTDPEDIESAGGPLAYAQAWLEHAAQDPKWKSTEASRAQLTLFRINCSRSLGSQASKLIKRLPYEHCLASISAASPMIRSKPSAFMKYIEARSSQSLCFVRP